MTELVFSFDTENYTSNDAADAIYHQAELLRKHSIKGCFCIVGLLAKQLMAWNRQDVINALQHHEICTHTYGHTMHPMLNEYTDIENFDDAYNKVIEEETLAIKYIQEALGDREITAAVPPGNQKSYVGMYAYADMGIPIFADTFCDTADGRGSYYCNIFHVAYNLGMEELFFKEYNESEYRRLLDDLAKRKHAVIYTHPDMCMYKQHWDALNYVETNCKFGEWRISERLPESLTQRFYENFEKFLRLVKKDARFHITTYGEIAKTLPSSTRIVYRQDVEWILQSLMKSFYPITTPISLSLSDMILAAKVFIEGKELHTCEKVYGFLEQPYEIKQTITLRAKDIIEASAQIEKGKFLPNKIIVAGIEIGPADWLYAALQVLNGEEKVVVHPKTQLPCLDELPEVRDCSFKGTWMHCSSFNDDYLSDRLRFQSWTLRFVI